MKKNRNKIILILKSLFNTGFIMKLQNFVLWSLYIYLYFSYKHFSQSESTLYDSMIDYSAWMTKRMRTFMMVNKHLFFEYKHGFLGQSCGNTHTTTAVHIISIKRKFSPKFYVHFSNPPFCFSRWIVYNSQLHNHSFYTIRKHYLLPHIQPL